MYQLQIVISVKDITITICSFIASLSTKKPSDFAYMRRFLTQTLSDKYRPISVQKFILKIFRKVSVKY